MQAVFQCMFIVVRKIDYAVDVAYALSQDSLLFFFSSRRRHTRSYGDWSSDVCSSDLTAATMPPVYRWIADQPGRFAILELPMPFRESEESERDAVRQIWLLYHGKARADEIGRASCRERVESWVSGGAVKRQ